MRFLVCDPIFEEHETTPGHPEGADRAGVIRGAFDELDDSEFRRIGPVKCEPGDLESIHSGEYVERVREASEAGESLDADTPTGERSFEVARYAVGSSMELARRCYDDETAGFGMVRPPGHHAERDRGMGFCLFNNVALSADLIARDGNRVAIIDIDVHHGNGTQQAFYDRSDVLYVSLHQSPMYPGTGSAEETGVGEGEGTTVNVPLSAGSGWSDLEPAWGGTIDDRIDSFDPDMIMVSAGFDGHESDPLGGLNFTDADYLTMADDIHNWASEHASSRVIGLLEGGYNRGVLRRLVPEFFRTL